MFENKEFWDTLTFDERLLILKEGVEQTATAVAQLVNFQTKASEAFLKAVTDGSGSK